MTEEWFTPNGNVSVPSPTSLLIVPVLSCLPSLGVTPMHIQYWRTHDTHNIRYRKSMYCTTPLTASGRYDIQSYPLSLSAMYCTILRLNPPPARSPHLDKLSHYNPLSKKKKKNTILPLSDVVIRFPLDLDPRGGFFLSRAREGFSTNHKISLYIATTHSRHFTSRP